MFKEISAKQLKDNFTTLIADEWSLITAGDKDGYNMMTASWGFAGELWGNDAVQIFIRPQRYTMKFVDESDYFTVSFYGENKGIHKICGSKSGRDIDKTAECGLTPVFDEKSVYFEQARIVIVCKKQYRGTLKREEFIDTAPLDCYPDGDFHHFVIGKIEKVLIKE